MFNALKKLLDPVPNSKKDVANIDEVGRSTLLGNLTGFSVWAILAMVWQVAQSIISDPSFVTNFDSFRKLFEEKNYLALFIGVGTFVFDYLRRKYLHGN